MIIITMPAMKKMNIPVRSLNAMGSADLNSFQTIMPHNAATIVAHCPKPYEMAYPAISPAKKFLALNFIVDNDSRVSYFPNKFAHTNMLRVRLILFKSLFILKFRVQHNVIGVIDPATINADFHMFNALNLILKGFQKIFCFYRIIDISDSFIKWFQFPHDDVFEHKITLPFLIEVCKSNGKGYRAASERSEISSRKRSASEAQASRLRLRRRAVARHPYPLLLQSLVMPVIVFPPR